MNKGNVVVDASPTINVDESTNDDEEIKIPVDDGNRIPHGEPVEHF